MSSTAQNGTRERKSSLLDLDIRYLPLTFDNTHPDESASKLVQAYSQEWNSAESPVVFVRFTEGITNTLIKATRKEPGKSRSEIDQDAILLRAYGNGTDVLIDRGREIKAHNALARRGLAPDLLARFDNGLLYRFVEGDVCSSQDLRISRIYRQVAKRLGQWHAIIPISEISKPSKTSKLPEPNMWSVMQQWLEATPEKTTSEKELKTTLKTELAGLEKRFGDMPGLLGQAFVFGHCDLLAGNVIVQNSSDSQQEPAVSFIDYEYATPSPAAFDIANHFAEWAGFDCDHTGCPTTSQRRDFIHHYVTSFYHNATSTKDVDNLQSEIEAGTAQLHQQVDDYRGIPGLYWGIWALIQAEISDIDFNYAEYAQIRLGEYWSWKHEDDGSRLQKGKDIPLRERRWAEE